MTDERQTELFRLPTREVYIANVGMGGNHPIRIQSMTSAPTMDTEATVREVLALEHAGCELVRITVPTIRDAENLKNIRERLNREKSKVPLIADIHYLPAAAMKSLEYVDKVRINPGNFVEKKKSPGPYSDREYEEELERTAETLRPLLARAGELGRVIRIGVNHGSLSERILGRYGNTPDGMVQSALEFIQIFENLSFFDIVVSLKSSNPSVMIEAYRLLAAKFLDKGSGYPLHLGVTEAGEGQDGRIKSAVGIGSLLSEGIGDTIRVSLTEDSVYEIPVARKIIEISQKGKHIPEVSGLSLMRSTGIPAGSFKNDDEMPSPFQAGPRRILAFRGLPSVSGKGDLRDHLEDLSKKGCDLLLVPANQRELAIEAIRSHNVNHPQFVFEVESLSHLPDEVIENHRNLLAIPLKLGERIETGAQLSARPVLIVLKIENTNFSRENLRTSLESLKTFSPFTIGITSDYQPPADNQEIAFNEGSIYRLLKKIVDDLEINATILPMFEASNLDDFIYRSSIYGGSLLIDNVASGMIISPSFNNPEIWKDSLDTTLNVYQSVGLRFSRAEYISCPSCGRTNFNLMQVTSRIKAKTSHLKGVKIGIMGCIVNGPGEMADADFGYVGSGPGRVDLYLGQEKVKRNIPEDTADDELIDLIKSSGRWVDASPGDHKK